MNTQSICSMSRVNHVLSPSKGANSDTGYMVKLMQHCQEKLEKPWSWKAGSFLLSVISSDTNFQFSSGGWSRILSKKISAVRAEPSSCCMGHLLPFCRWITSPKLYRVHRENLWQNSGVSISPFEAGNQFLYRADFTSNSAFKWWHYLK